MASVEKMPSKCLIMIIYSLQLDTDQWIIPYFPQASTSLRNDAVLQLDRIFVVSNSFIKFDQIWLNGVSRLVELQPNTEVNHQNWALNFVVEDWEVMERQDSF